MSFICGACGQHLAGSTSVGPFAVCSNCQHTQMGRACMILTQLDAKAIEERMLVDLNHILDEAQNEPPEGAADGSIDEVRFNRIRSLVHAARAYNAILDKLRGQ